MKFLTQIITLDKTQYVIQSKVTIWTRLVILLKILVIIALALQSGIEHIRYTLTRQTEALAITLVAALIIPKRGRVYV